MTEAVFAAEPTKAADRSGSGNYPVITTDH